MACPSIGSLSGNISEWSCKVEKDLVALSKNELNRYRSLNAILQVEGRSDNLVLLRLLEAHCVPLITYAIETLHVADRDEKRSLRVAYNSIFRKLFGYRYFESVTNLQHALGRPTWEELVQKRQNGFLNRARSSESNLVAALC